MSAMLTKKILPLIFLGALVFSFWGCEKSIESTDILRLSASMIKQGVRGWAIYTNPTFRYELRYPNDWEVQTSGEDGVWASFHLKGNQREIFRVNGYTNWQEGYDLPQFYLHQPKNLLQSGFEQRDVEIAGQTGIWLKNVRGQVEGDAEAAIDLVAFELGDRIIEIKIFQEWEDSKMVLNSIKFYSNKTISDLK